MLTVEAIKTSSTVRVSVMNRVETQLPQHRQRLKQALRRRSLAVTDWSQLVAMTGTFAHGRSYSDFPLHATI